jgi:ATP-dependent helicase/nuclease subunit B
MLRLLLGLAGTGKTAAMMEEIRERGSDPQFRAIFVVPENYSHEAERELCSLCGNRASAYTEVMSFRDMCRRYQTEKQETKPLLDNGGRILSMSLAVEEVADRLQVFRRTGGKADVYALLLRSMDELRASKVDVPQLREAAAQSPEGLAAKLEDLAAVMEAYDGVLSSSYADPSDSLFLLEQRIEAGGVQKDREKFFMDGFSFFTAQERGVMEALLRCGTDITVSLTCDAGQDETFAVSRATVRELQAMAARSGTECREIWFDEGKHASPYEEFARAVISYRLRPQKASGPVALRIADTMEEECEYAAALCHRLVREKNCRWRDIAVAVRGFEEYRLPLEDSFRRYGVPLFCARKSDLLSKPLPAMITSAYNIITRGWATEDVMAYLRTGLAGLSQDDVDVLDSYVFLWKLRGSAWTRTAMWRQHPDGYGGTYDETAENKLQQIHALRLKIVPPLQHFEQHAKQAETAAQQAAALADFLTEIHLTETLQKKAAMLEQDPTLRIKAQEYRQLWEIIIRALQQAAAVLADRPMQPEVFGNLFSLVLSQYDVGTIPVSLDSVTAGDFDRMRRRNIRYLLVLGADDGRIPGTGGQDAVFTEDELQKLQDLHINLNGGEEVSLWNEYFLIYQTFTLPHNGLWISYARTDGKEEKLPAYLFRRAGELYSLSAEHINIEEIRAESPRPCRELAAKGFEGAKPLEKAALQWLEETDPAFAEKLKATSQLTRGQLSRDSVDKLYGKSIHLSASRSDKYASCPFEYFLQYGLRAKPRKPAEFEPPEIGTFMHFVLQKVAAEVKTKGGFRQVSQQKITEMTEHYIKEYIENELQNFREKSARFRYLFGNICREVKAVVQDMAEELRHSDFEPLEFEMDIQKENKIQIRTVGNGAEKALVTGIVDRVDGWKNENTLYLRVIDYKTGRKKFSFSDVWYGRSMQMLLYLTILEENGQTMYGCKVLPAGVLYLPAREEMLTSSRHLTEEQRTNKRTKTLQRSGVLLSDSKVLRAMDTSGQFHYLPVRETKSGTLSGEPLVSEEELQQLESHVSRKLVEFAKEIEQGQIQAQPFFQSESLQACGFCDYAAACHFSDGSGTDRIRYTPKLTKKTVKQMLEEENNG